MILTAKVVTYSTWYRLACRQSRAGAEPAAAAAGGGVAALAGFVVDGEVGGADWSGLLSMASEVAAKTRRDAQTVADCWLQQGKQGRAEAEGYSRAATQGSRSRRGASGNKYASYAAGAVAKAEAAAVALETAAAALRNAAAAFKVEEEKEHVVGVAADEGVLVAALKAAFNAAGISVQRYWNATLMGPDCRTLLAGYVSILATISAAIVAAGHGEEEALGFVARHSRVLKPLEVVSRGTRRVIGKGPNGLLDDGEKTALKSACAAFGVAWRNSYPNPRWRRTSRGS